MNINRFEQSWFCFLFFLIYSQNIFAQEPTVCYGFILFNKDNKNVSQENHRYRFNSWSLNGKAETPYDAVFYNSICSTLMICQTFNAIRDYYLLVIIDKETNDTMNIFLEKYLHYYNYKFESVRPRELCPNDSIIFQKGNFNILNKPALYDWKNVSDSGNIEVIHGDIIPYLRRKFPNGVRCKQKN